ncbi:MAG: pyridoxamine 5'-phosphate oxidase family protein [Candidatus Saccharimonadales bacterium]
MSKSLTLRQRRIYDFLLANPTGVLATADPADGPHGAVIYFCVDDEFVISFLIKNASKSQSNLNKNDRVVLVIYDQTSQTVAQVTGRAVEVKDKQQVNAIADKLMRLEPNQGPLLSPQQSASCLAYQIFPDQIRMAYFGRPDSQDFNGLFESLESFVLKEDGI